jgi:histidinol dehydrogenase
VRSRGDEAVLEYARRYDRVQASAVADLEIGKPALKAAFDSLPAEQASALREAAARIRRFHERQLTASWDYTEEDGTLLGQRVTALDRVDCMCPAARPRIRPRC